jgi:superoxide dismutase
MSFAVKPLPFDATRIAGLSEHTHSLTDGRPILALDIYEHSYHLDYGAKAAAYIDVLHEGHQLGRCRPAAGR